MALGGPMFSEFLLMSMYASASRLVYGMGVDEQRTQGDLFTRLAKEYLAKELDGPTKITTIQGLLLLSARECVLGEISQGWNHAGLAFRMIQDLGVHLAPSEVAGSSSLSLEEQATRDRLFWAAFIWDKSMSLALGREPTLAARKNRDPSSMADFDDDNEPWTPYSADPASCSPAFLSYVYQPKQRVAAFRFYAHVCLVGCLLVLRETHLLTGLRHLADRFFMASSWNSTAQRAGSLSANVEPPSLSCVNGSMPCGSLSPTA
ncbi:fungal-specific transcription factor domain-containing protein [Microdochium trichocladiopsis]|uniref:Fungal-specific transcription factor domain-containing protein n=1 Tax=Microdochium trichocladiopsis TaxID=1682393 RepID=A0A9P9BQ83_9PEZI|nr:fungal-specific transcription factor domain-containing protein [Microdochium trichocladiopsis]KAH7030573.1 fungal-specific transcription factor domain-containing protein [Microdochium trichocladiopsis]